MSQSSTFIYDRIFGVMIVILAISYGLLAKDFETPFSDESIGPSTFPIIISILLGLSGLALILKPQGETSFASAKTWIEIVITLASLIIFALLLEPLGFIFSTILCCGIISWRMGAKPIKAFGIACGYSIFLYILFDKGLDLSLPTGILGGIL